MCNENGCNFAKFHFLHFQKLQKNEFCTFLNVKIDFWQFLNCQKSKTSPNCPFCNIYVLLWHSRTLKVGKKCYFKNCTFLRIFEYYVCNVYSYYYYYSWMFICRLPTTSNRKWIIYDPFSRKYEALVLFWHHPVCVCNYISNVIYM